MITAIAAGEIAERPAVIIKELVENSLDAGATLISIILENSGLDRMIVSDNGLGMTDEDLVLAVQRHTTSKISTVDELQNLQTLGFRGEALASIVSVSQVTIASRTPESEFGYELVATNTRVAAPKPLGLPLGTSITVEKLFSQVPVRKKFQKQPATELKHLTETLTALAISFPSVGFEVKHNQNLIFRVPPSQTATQRIASLFGASFSANLLEVNHEHPGLNVTGFIGSPQLARRTHSQQFLFVNQRLVEHPALARKVKAVFGSLLEPRSEPVFILNLTLPPSEVDVNIHPRKQTVAFADELAVLALIESATLQALSQHDLTYHYQPLPTTADSLHDGSGIAGQDRTASPATRQQLKQVVEPWHLSLTPNQEILQVHQTYLVMQVADGLVMIDQHAAHERILYEQFLGAFHAQQHQQQESALEVPQIIELSPSDTQLLQAELETLNQLGFDISPFGGQSFKVCALPELLKDRDAKTVITEFIDELHQDTQLSGIDSAAQRTLAFLACRNAVKAGDYLTPDQRLELVSQLKITNTHFTCPHGRPVTVAFDLRTLEKIFKRR